MTEEKNTTEKKVEKKSESGAAVEDKVAGKKSSFIGFLVTVVIFCLLAAAIVLVFLNGRKLNQQVVELQRNLTALQTGEKAISHRVAALEDEFVVLDLKRRLNKINKSVKELTALKTILSDNPEMVEKVQVLVDGLAEEQKRLESEITGSAPKEFKSTRSEHQAPAQYKCCPKSGKCVLLQNVPDSHALVSPLSVAVAGGHDSGPAVVKELVPVAKSQTGWSKFINTRLFGN